MNEINPLRGVAFMAASGLAFVCVTALVKLAGQDVPAPQAAFLRYLLGLPFLLPVLGELRRFRPSRRLLGLFVFRGLMQALAVMFWFLAMTRIPLAEVTAMNYLVPIYVTLGAALIFGERLALRRLAAIAVALVGAMVVLRPGFRQLDTGHYAMLVATVFFAASYLSAMRLSGQASAAIVVAMLSIVVPFGMAPFALASWQPVGWQDLGLFFLTAAMATLGHYLMTRAFASAPLTVTQPVTFLQLVWAVALGAAVFGEGIDLWVILGGAMIMAAIGYMTLREAQLRRRATPAVGESER